MKPGGLLLILAGMWVLCQVLGGSALKRLGLDKGDAAASTPEFGTTPDKGYSGVPHNAQGYPL